MSSELINALKQLTGNYESYMNKLINRQHDAIKEVIMTKINLHELFESRMNELSKDLDEECSRQAPCYQDSKETFKNGYTAALNDLQGKVDGLLKALETAHENACGCCNSCEEVEKHCLKAIAEFTALAGDNGDAT